MASLAHVVHVTKKYKRFGYGLIGIFGCGLMVYVCINLWNIAQGPRVVERSIPGFGPMPDFVFSKIPGNSSTVSFGFYSVTASMGMEIGNDVDGVKVTSNGAKVKVHSSAFTLPDFYKIRKMHPRVAPTPKLSIAILYKSITTSAAIHGLYLKAEDPTCDCETWVGSLRPSAKSLHEGSFDTKRFSIGKLQRTWMWTRNTMNWEGLSHGCTKTFYEYVIARKGTNKQTHVNCSRLLAGESWAVGQEDSFNFKPFDDAKDLSRASVCTDSSWKMVHLMLYAHHDSVREIQRIGALVQVIELFGSLGGLLSMGGAVFACVFIEKNKHSKRFQHVHERTFVGDGKIALIESLVADPDHETHPSDDSDSSDSGPS